MVISTIWTSIAAAWRGRLDRRERGAIYVEYGLLLVLIAVFCVVALSTLGAETSSLIVDTNESIADAG